MKANEFVKRFGLEWAREVVKNQPETDAQIFNPYNQKYSSSYTIKKGVSVAHLKRLVESWELVEKYKNRHGGIRHRIRWGQFRHGDTQEYNNRLQQAIADVESCQ